MSEPVLRSKSVRVAEEAPINRTPAAGVAQIVEEVVEPQLREMSRRNAMMRPPTGRGRGTSKGRGRARGRTNQRAVILEPEARQKTPVARRVKSVTMPAERSKARTESSRAFKSGVRTL
ncbi:hypothetical protein OSB04_un000323 [Centaurea solstitialis]|uniref:Uncharacterized protein n=1 Tax=Centaurea solstitialis TaxID=347529 RepID=A0AA38SHM0_9ASTR|nr:hypothetical protein OSB04_un000323 [Centaurea solstitialis]